VGYSDKQLVELEATITATPCDAVLIGTPVDLARLIKIDKPHQRIRYHVTERHSGQLGALLAGFLQGTAQ
jgi:predicted GTPase